ncbi:A-kinase anchor protein 8-like [Arapaima gigas]
MYGRAFASGCSSWGGGASRRGVTGYDLYSNKDPLSGSRVYDGGHGGRSLGPMKQSVSIDSQLPSTGTNADAIIARINQRLSVLSQLEGGLQGGGRAERFDQYESLDSYPSSLTPHNLFRSGSQSFGCGPGGPNFGAGGSRGSGGSSYGPARAHMPRHSASVPAWAAECLTPGMGGASSHRFEHRQDLPPVGTGYQSRSQSKIPSLLSHHVHPEAFPYRLGPGLQDFSSGGQFGGGTKAGRQRGRKRPLNQQLKPRQQDGQNNWNQEPEMKKIKIEMGSDEPNEGKMHRSSFSLTHNPIQHPPPHAYCHSVFSSMALVMLMPDPSLCNDHLALWWLRCGIIPVTFHYTPTPALMMQEEINQVKKQLQGKQPSCQSSFPKQKRRKGFLERVTFACSICKFRSFYKEEMTMHMESRFHKEHFKFLSSQISKPTTDFLQEYLQNKFRKTELRWKQTEKLNATICQVYKEQDLTRDVDMEHFIRKVEAAHCAACDLFIPMQNHLIQRHLRSPDHNYKRKFLLEQSKRSGLVVARSILNHKVIGRKLESYLKGENPFAEDAEKDLEGIRAPPTANQEDEHGEAVNPPQATLEAEAHVKTEEQQLERKAGLEELKDREPKDRKGCGGPLEGANEAADDVLRAEVEGVEEASSEEDEGVEAFLGEEDEGILGEEDEHDGLLAVDYGDVLE